MAKNMDQMQRFEKKFESKPRLYNLFKAFNPHAYMGVMGRTDVQNWGKDHTMADQKLMDKFHRRFPMLKVTPKVYNFYK